jgi:hypothetical protein
MRSRYVPSSMTRRTSPGSRPAELPSETIVSQSPMSLLSDQ